MKTMTLEEYLDLCKERFGEDMKNWKFICPMCKTEQSIQDFINIEMDVDEIEGYIGFSCIGRFTGQGEPTEESKGKGCNWTLGGLIPAHNLEIIKDGKGYPRFEIAEKK